MIKKVFLACVLISSAVFSASGQDKKSSWVDSVFNALDIDEKIGQLMMVQVTSYNDAKQLQNIEDEIKTHHIGGIVFMQGGPVRQVAMRNHLQAISQVPLFVAQDSEWGPGMMLDSAISFPRALLLGAIRNDTMTYAVGKEIAIQLKMLGVNINFAPVVDVNLNPDNAISYRSFGSNSLNVTNKAVAFMRGLQDNGVMACAKHFPVNGLTIVDVQKGLPIIKPHIDSAKAYTFQKLIESGLRGIVPAATDFPLFYQSTNLVRKNKFSANALSSIFTGELLKNQLHYEGLVFVDIVGMQTTTHKFRSGEAEMFAFQTGNDVLLSPQDIGPAVRKIKKLIKKQNQYEAQLNASVKKILAAKYDAGLDNKLVVGTDNLIRKLNSTEAQVLNQQLNEQAITVINNSQNILPVVTLENKHFAYITSDTTHHNNQFYHYLSKYIKPASYVINNKTNFDELQTALRDNQTIIVSIFPQTPTESIQKLLPTLKTLSTSHEIILCDFGHETFLKQASEFSTLITAYSNTQEMLMAVPQAIFGGIMANGELPFTISSSKEGAGYITKKLNRFTYGIAESSKMDGETLNKIEAIANEAISMGATPGCHVLVAKDGKVVYEKSFGYLTYENKIPVSDETIYDLASVTKVSATLQAVMFMYEKGLIDINKKISVYLPEFKESNKKDFTIKDILTHQAGLWPFLPFWAQTMKDGQYLPEFYSKTKSNEYPLMVAENLYAPISMRDSLWGWIIKSKIRDKASRTPFDYKYSDMGFYIMQHLAERLLNQPLEDFIQQNLYEPLGSSTTGYLPLERFPVNQIAPTEDDKLFRKTLLIGTVHDQGAAMSGGVAGHAGFFSNANDLAKLGQMLLQEGNYGGYQYYKPSTVRTFTQRQFETSRRGLGWDKPTQSEWNGPTSLYSSPKTFGHTGFTGTCIWVDPEFNLVYVFLSNRVNPDMTNNKLINANIRPRIQDVIYESVFKYCQEH